jgi:WhiB family redox-sensing transcriptional regulator
VFKPLTSEPFPDLKSWHDRSACRGMDTDLFFEVDFARGAPKRAHEAAAKAVCATCPVTEQCLARALTFDEPHGIWGGLTRDERRTLRDSEEPRPNFSTGRLEAEIARRWEPAQGTSLHPV